MAFADSLPKRHRFGLSKQLERSSASVSSNIAEGAGRGTAGDFARFLRVAIGSVGEADAQLRLCEISDFGNPAMIAKLRNEASSIRRQLYALERRVRSQTYDP